MEPGANPPVDVFPILKLIPTRFAPWKRRALHAGSVMDAVWGGALKTVRERRATGEKRDCIADKIINEYEAKGGQPLIEHKLQNLLGEMVEGGADTTSAQLLTFIMAMACYPRVQAKAQALIDEVIPPTRSPNWSDFDKLQYVNAMVKEGMRWRPVSSVALPHRAREDDYYDGMFIPKDTTIWVAVWYSPCVVVNSGLSITILIFSTTRTSIVLNDSNITTNSPTPMQAVPTTMREVSLFCPC